MIYLSKSILFFAFSFSIYAQSFDDLNTIALGPIVNKTSCEFSDDYLNDFFPFHCIDRQNRNKENIVVLKPSDSYLSELGINLWPGDPLQEKVLKLLSDLNLTSARFTGGPNWDNLSVRPPKNSSLEEMEKYIQQNSDGDFPHRLDALKSLVSGLDTKKLKKNFIQFKAPKDWRNKSNELKKESINDYAKFLVAQMKFYKKNGIELDTIELANEPDGNWDTKISPHDYVELLRSVKKLMSENNLDLPKISGPGLAFIKNSQDWIKAFESAGVLPDNLSFHAWDQKLNKEVQIGSAADWAKAHQIPVQITEFAEAETHWYSSGTIPDKTRDKSDSISYSPNYALKSANNMLKLFNTGANGVVFWEASDQQWNNMSWGMMNVDGSLKPVYFSMLSQLKNLEPGMRILKTEHESNIAAFENDKKMVLNFVNIDDKKKKIKLDLSQYKLKGIGKILRFKASNPNQTEQFNLSLTKNIDCLYEIELPANTSYSIEFFK